MASSVNHDSWTLGSSSEDGKPSVISVMPNSSSQRSENLDIRIAGRDMHATSSNVNLTLKIGVGYPELPSLKQHQSKQDEMERWGSSLVSVLLGILRTSFPSLFLPSSDGHLLPSISENSAQAHASGELAEDGVEIDLAHRPQDVPDPLAPNLAYHEVYVHTLLGEKLGLPCWEPRPLGLGNQSRGTVPGDVGTYTTEGGFHRLFNLWEDQATLCSISDTCRASMGCQGVNTKHHTTPDWMKGGDAIAYGASTETPLKRLSERPRVDVLYEFVCDSSSGAVLATPTSADKDEAEDIVEMERYVRTHAEAIYRHANAIRLIGEASSLYVVTDCIKSNTWAMAAYKGEMNPNRNTLELVAVSQPSDGGSDCMPTYKWTKRGSAHARWGSSSGVKDQTLFLRGLKMAFSASFRSRVHKIKAENDNSNSPEPIDGGSNTLGDPPGRPNGRSDSDGGDQQQRSVDHSLSLAQLSLSPETSSTSDPVLELAPFPSDSSSPYHPSDVINAYVLEQTGCEIAICHDSAWELLSEGSSISPTADVTVSLYHVDPSAGGGQQVQHPDSPHDEHATTSSTMVPMKHVHFAEGNIAYDRAPSPSWTATSSSSSTPSLSWTATSTPASVRPLTPPSTWDAHDPLISHTKMYGGTPLTRIHPILSDREPLTYDLSLPPPTATVTDLKFSKVQLAFNQPATEPPLPYLEITHPRLPWKLAVRPTAGTIVTVADVIAGIYTNLRTNISALEFQMAGSHTTDSGRQQRITAAYQARCTRFPQEEARRKELQKGVKRIDFLEGVNMFAGLGSTKDGAHIWRLKTTAQAGPGPGIPDLEVEREGVPSGENDFVTSPTGGQISGRTRHPILHSIPTSGAKVRSPDPLATAATS